MLNICWKSAFPEYTAKSQTMFNFVTLIWDSVITSLAIYSHQDKALKIMDIFSMSERMEPQPIRQRQ